MKTDRTEGDDEEEVNMQKPAIKLPGKISTSKRQDTEYSSPKQTKKIKIRADNTPKEKQSLDPNQVTRRQSVKYMTMDPTEERSSSPSGRRKTIRESLQSDQVKLTLAKEVSSPTRRQASLSRNMLYLAATGK